MTTWNDEVARRYDFMLPVTNSYATPALKTLLQQADIIEAEYGTCELKILDLACGTGSFAHIAADMLPKSTIHGTDMSQDMMNVFTAKTQHMGLTDRITAEVLDGQNLHTIHDNAFDLVGCVFGIMFFPDRSKGWKEIYRVLKPGGHAAVVAWVDSDLLQMMRQVCAEIMPEGETHPALAASVCCADPDRITDEIRTAASFKHIHHIEQKYDITLPRDRVCDFSKEALFMRLGKAAVAETGMKELTAVVDRGLGQYASDDGTCTMRFHAVTYVLSK